MSLAFVFPGQGSQSIGMMAPFEELPAVRRTFDEAGVALGFDLWALVRDGPAEELNKTVNTQPAMLVAGIALFRAWRELGGTDPVAVAGHSLGEYSALVAAGVMDFAEAVPFVRYRAQVMQEAVPEGQGAIAAILGLDDQAVRTVCEEAAAAGVVEPANFNSPEQIVIAGSATGVHRAIELAKSRGAKRAMLLPMSAPSHCSLMRPAAERLRDPLAALHMRAPAIAVVNNVEGVRALAGRGVQQIVECGPGGVLTGLNKRITPEPKTVSLKDAAILRELAAQSKQ